MLVNQESAKMNSHPDERCAMDLLERAIHHSRFGTARKVAAFLGCTEAHLSNVRGGKRNLQPIHAAKLAEAIGEPWLEHVLPIMADLEPNAEDRAYWLGKARTLARAAAVGLVVAAASPNVNALNHSQTSGKSLNLNDSLHYRTRRKGKPFRKQPHTRPWGHTARRSCVLRHKKQLVRETKAG